ncbi:VOC family protein [Dermatobacter hominis]|uniref:VOC family protein n=1 Tax=Dermatobacter hominis TaxID=2884263 RepID=UPI001D0FF458|nr:VOC family protein [Dermatobacter hominis]UDY36609.1 VOC family protein [Dermatobacter hominis]
MPSLWPQTLLVVDDVERSSRFYCDLLGLRSGHGGDEYEQLLHDDELVLQLHSSAVDHHHDALADPDVARGNGVLVWFEVDDFEGALDRVRATGAPIERDAELNPNAQQWEVWVRDPDGYSVVIAGPTPYRPR